MSKQNRQRSFFILLMFIYLAALASLTLMPDQGIDFIADNNFVPFKSIAGYCAVIAKNGIFNTGGQGFAAEGATSAFSFFSYAFKNLAGNILLFVPMGLLFPLCRKKKTGFFLVMIIVLGTSLFIEVMQYFWFLSRSADVDDVILNLLGGVLGYLIYKWVS